MKHYVGMDLHSTNTYIGIIDDEDKRVLKGKFSNDLNVILKVLNPYKEAISGVVVESTFNWYWLVDGLMEQGYKVHLAHPAATVQYNGLKYTNDKHDAFFLAKLLLLGILPEGYIYPKEERQIRDLLRKRLMLVRQSTTHILSFKSLVNRNIGISINSNDIKKLEEDDIDSMFKNEHLILSAKANISTMNYLKDRIKHIEKIVLKETKLKPEFERLLTVPGIGKVLGLTIALETGNINRFKEPGNYASYCRCVNSKRISNEKSKGQNNRKNGNKYLSWAFIEAANKSKQFCPYAKMFIEKKVSKRNFIVAIKALAHKLARACYYIMRDNVNYDISRIFSVPKETIKKGDGSKPAKGLDKEPKAPIGNTAVAKTLVRV